MSRLNRREFLVLLRLFGLHFDLEEWGCFSETSVNFRQNTRRHIAEANTFQ
jgi:hypothetical protein